MNTCRDCLPYDKCKLHYKPPFAGTVEPHEKRYCSHCGALCIEQLQGAEKNLHLIMDSGGGHEYPEDTPYDKKTGQRNYCYEYICPNYKEKRWFGWSPHDNYFVDKVIKI